MLNAICDCILANCGVIKRTLLLFSACAGLLIFGCQSENSPKSKPEIEYWKGHVHTERVDIPFRFRMQDSALVLINSEERIDLPLSYSSSDSASYYFPMYDAELTIYLPFTDKISGKWNSSSRNFQLPFSAETYVPVSPSTADSLYGQITFLSPDSSRSFPAIGAFAMSSESVAGTFLTETGDYRYMEGVRRGKSFELSTFDGDHLYYSKATIHPDSTISGKFYSGNNPPYTWSGSITDNPTLTPSDKITTISREDSTLNFKAYTLDGDSVLFGPKAFYGKVTVVSAFGSWCPNCHDELRMYSELVAILDDPSLHIVPVAFERQETVDEAAPVISKVINQVGTPFPAYYAGKASKSFASKYFDGIGEIKAFPTSVIIDKRGKIRKVFSGFSGPGTGHYYHKHKEEVTDLISRLLAE